MLIFVARYFVLLTLSIGSNQGEELQMPNMDTLDLNIFKISGCISRCMHEEKRQQQEQSFLKSCYDHCIVQNATTLGSVRKIQENLQLKLVCRDDRSLSFRIDTENALLMAVSNSSALSNIAYPASAMNATIIAEPQSSNINDSPTIYVVKIHLAKDTRECFVYMTDDNFFTIDTLKPNSNYNITAVAVHANSEYSIITRNEMYATLVGGYTPGMILETEVKNFRADESNAMRLTAEIAWKPAADTTCHYNVISYSHLIPEYDVIPWDLRYTRTHTHAFILDNLTFSTEYNVGIRAINANNTSKESEIFWTTIHVPSCLKWHHKNYNICAPLPPEGLHVEQFLIGEDQYSLNISWDQPKISPSYYVLRIYDLFENGSSYLANASQLQTSVFLQNVTLFGPMFDAHLSAYTPGGNATSYKTNSKKHGPLPKKQNIVKLISAIFAPMLCIVILLLTTFTICHRRAKLKRYRERCKYFEELEKKAPIDPKSTFKFTTKALSEPTTLEDLTQLQLDLEEKICFNDAMEIERDDVMLYELLGEGAFGMVRRGIYQDVNLGAREVAVKMLKDHPTLDDVRAFRCEIEVMKSVERHPNIVGIIGHCTKRCTEMLLLTEYCSFGNLLNFLRNEWKYLHELNAKVDVVSLPPTTTHNKGNIGNRGSNKMAQLQTLPSPPPPPPTHKPHKNPQSCHNKNHNKLINHNNNNNIVQQFDTTLIGKIKQKYKSFNGSNNNDSSSNANAATKSNIAKEQQHRHIEELTLIQPSNAVATAAENKSYGYDEICSNSCKCQVDILTIKDVAASQEAEQLERLLQHSGNTTTVSMPTITIATSSAAAKTIQIKNCDCNIAQKNQKNKASSPPTPVAPMLSIENKGYYKNLLEQVITLKNTKSAEATKTTQNDLAMLHRINSVHTKLNEELSSSLKREPLVASDLLDIARQVAIGMEFLAKNKVVHRDLAARNVLVAPDRTIKIADFGLSRDVYQENIYKKTGNGKLPIKWLALESMTHQVYTTQSDVWSYGILLYEIVTLGGTPYPSIPTNRLLHLLKSGYRMEKPKNCGLEFYDLMYSCWNINTGERPNFTQIIKTLDKLLLFEVAEEKAPQTLEIETISATKVQSTEPLCSDDSYLKPLHYVSPSASPPSALD